MCLCIGTAYDIPTTALRFFNVYGSHQALSNPYTGVAAIFCARLLNDRPPLVFEDGKQQRDFVHVDDVARAVVMAAEQPVPGEAMNIGSGEALSVRDIAEQPGARTRQRHCPADRWQISPRGHSPLLCGHQQSAATTAMGAPARVPPGRNRTGGLGAGATRRT